MNFKISAIIICSLIMTTCVPPSSYQTYQRQTMTSTHRYELFVKDISGNPIEGAEIDYTTERDFNEYDSGKVSATPDGKIALRVSHTDTPILDEVQFSSSIKYKISKDGYYTLSGNRSIIYSSNKSVTESATLLKPIDYIEPNFLSSSEGKALKVNILRFIDLIRLQSLLADAYLKPQSISVIEFKEKNYLHFSFISTSVYNSLRLNKYDIGKRLFDEVVRKVLNPLNEYISDPKAFYGYDLEVIGHTKNFTNEYATGQPIEYRFMMPEKIVKKYKDKDISGQQVLDSSIVLMDDERTELKLQ